MPTQVFTRNEYDHYVNFKWLKSSDFICLLLYVNDMPIASRSKVEIDNVKAQLSNEFEIQDFGGVKKILGLKIVKDRKNGILWLMQNQHLKKSGY